MRETPLPGNQRLPRCSALARGPLVIIEGIFDALAWNAPTCKQSRYEATAALPKMLPRSA
jgi:hypothetical protein